MRTPTDKEIIDALVGIISDGFNRSLRSLEGAGAVDTRKMMSEYRGVGSRYYDLVTDRIVLTATYAVPSIKKLFDQETDLNSRRYQDP